MRNSVFAVVAVVGLAGATLAGEPLKSGPQVGQTVDAFEPRNVTGPWAGEEHCLVCWTASRPGVMILARSVSDPLTGLLKKLDAANKDQGKKMTSFAVFLDDQKGLDAKLKAIADKEKIETTLLAIDNPKDTGGELVPKDADITIVLFVKHKVKVNRAYRKGEFKTEDIDKVLKDLPKLLEAAEKE